MWNIKYMTVLPVTIMRATGVVTKGLKKNFEAVPGKSAVDSVQVQLCLEQHT